MGGNAVQSVYARSQVTPVAFKYDEVCPGYLRGQGHHGAL